MPAAKPLRRHIRAVGRPAQPRVRRQRHVPAVRQRRESLSECLSAHARLIILTSCLSHDRSSEFHYCCDFVGASSRPMRVRVDEAALVATVEWAFEVIEQCRGAREDALPSRRVNVTRSMYIRGRSRRASTRTSTATPTRRRAATCDRRARARPTGLGVRRRGYSWSVLVCARGGREGGRRSPPVS